MAEQDDVGDLAPDQPLPPSPPSPMPLVLVPLPRKMGAFHGDHVALRRASLHA